MNKGYFVPVTIVILLLILAGIVLFAPLNKVDIVEQNTSVEENITTILDDTEVIEDEELPPVIGNDTQGETDITEEVQDSSPQIPAGIPTPECAQDPNCANQLGCTTDPETGMTVCY